jgi:hypothetical protein
MQASSWTQSATSGGVGGRPGIASRQRHSPPAYALLQGYLLGLRGMRLFQTPWTRVLDSSPSELLALAADAKRLGGLGPQAGGNVVEVAFPTLLTEEERAMSRGDALRISTDRYERHIAAPWLTNLAAPRRPFSLSTTRTTSCSFLAKRQLFELATKRHGHGWPISISPTSSHLDGERRVQRGLFRGP